VGVTPGAVAEPRPGYVEIGRETIGRDTYIYYVRQQVKEHFDAINRELSQVETNTARTKRAILSYENALPGYMKQIDEWLSMDREARVELTKAEMSFACDVMLATAARDAEQHVQLGREAIGRHWDEFQRSPFNDPAVRRILAAERRITPIVRKWQSREEMLQTMHQLYDGVKALDAAHQGEYWETLANVLKTQVHDPILQFMVADFEFFVAATYAQVRTRTAAARVEQLNQLGTSRLAEIKSLSAVYRRQIDRRNVLKRERDAILSEAKQGKS
jgi:hypothetical protein